MRGKSGYQDRSRSRVLGSGRRRLGPNPRPHPGLSLHPAEQARLRFLDDLEFSLAVIHPELIESGLLGFLDGSTSCLNPFHGRHPLLLFEGPDFCRALPEARGDPDFLPVCVVAAPADRMPKSMATHS